MATESEKYFEQFCRRCGFALVPVQVATTKTPDYTLTAGGQLVVVEVKESSRPPKNSNPTGSHASAESGQRERKGQHEQQHDPTHNWETYGVPVTPAGSYGKKLRYGVNSDATTGIDSPARLRSCSTSASNEFGAHGLNTIVETSV